MLMFTFYVFMQELTAKIFYLRTVNIDHGCMICYSLGPIFGFAKYLKQVCLSFSPYLELYKSLLEVGERRHTKRPW